MKKNATEKSAILIEAEKVRYMKKTTLHNSFEDLREYICQMANAALDFKDDGLFATCADMLKRMAEYSPNGKKC